MPQSPSRPVRPGPQTPLAGLFLLVGVCAVLFAVARPSEPPPERTPTLFQSREIPLRDKIAVLGTVGAGIGGFLGAWAGLRSDRRLRVFLIGVPAGMFFGGLSGAVLGVRSSVLVALLGSLVLLGFSLMVRATSYRVAQREKMSGAETA